MSDARIEHDGFNVARAVPQLSLRQNIDLRITTCDLTGQSQMGMYPQATKSDPSLEPG